MRAWDDRPNFLKDIFALREPVVITGSPASKWAALTMWTPSYLAETASVLPSVTTNVMAPPYDRTIMQSNENCPMAQVWKQRRSPTERVQNMTGQEFFRLCDEHGAVYYSGSINSTDPTGRLWSSLQPMTGLLHSNPDDAQPGTMRLSAANIQSQARYDPLHSLLVQLRGNKTVRLVAARHWAAIGSVSRLHPATGQAQANLSSLSTVHQLTMQNIEVSSAELSPGDVLFVPAFQFASSSSMGATSASLSLYHPAHESDAYRALLRDHLVPRSLFPPGRPELRLQATHFFLKALLLLTLGSPSAASEFMGQVFETRHRGSYPWHWSGRSQGQDPSFRMPVQDRAMPGARAKARVSLACRLGLQNERLQVILEAHATGAHATWRWLPEGIQHLALADYIEETCHHILGLEGAVQLFSVRGCFEYTQRSPLRCCTQDGDGLNCELCSKH